MLDGEPSYGYDLRRRLDVQGVPVDAAVLYRTLRKFETDGWVRSRWVRAASGPPRRFYKLTARGRRRLDEIAEIITGIRDVHATFASAYTDAKVSRKNAESGGMRSADSGDG
jgi:PadR family transcriptional regulator PadR